MRHKRRKHNKSHIKTWAPRTETAKVRPKERAIQTPNTNGLGFGFGVKRLHEIQMYLKRCKCFVFPAFTLFPTNSCICLMCSCPCIGSALCLGRIHISAGPGPTYLPDTLFTRRFCRIANLLRYFSGPANFQR